MDAIDFFLLRYEGIHQVLKDPAIKQLTPAQWRGRPSPRVNTIAWLLWHMARIEDVGVNRLVADRPQVLEEGWLARLGLERRDVGTGMTDAEVDDLSLRIDLDALGGYWDTVTRRTLEVATSLRGSDLETVVPRERVEQVVRTEGVVAPGAEWLTELWADRRTRAWVLAQTPLLHVSGHTFEARTIAGLWGIRGR